MCPPFARTHICAVDHATGSLLIYDQIDTILQSVVLSEVDVTDLGAVDSFLQNPPSRVVHQIEFWDLDCSVANTVGWWSRVSLLTAVQQSHGLGGLEHCTAGRWINHQTQNEWLAATVVWTVIRRYLRFVTVVGKNWKSLKRNKRYY